MRDEIGQLPEDGPAVSDLRTKARTFDREIRNRNLREVLVAGFLVAVFGRAVFVFAERPVAAVGMALIALASLAVAIRIIRRGTGPTSAPEAPTNRFLAQSAAERRYQARLLRSVPIWYAGPFVPGMVLFLGDTLVAAGPGHRLVPALSAAVVASVFAIVIWMNLRASRELSVEADALETMIPNH